MQWLSLDESELQAARLGVTLEDIRQTVKDY